MGIDLNQPPEVAHEAQVTIEASINGSQLTIATVVARFNRNITHRLLNGVIEGLEACEVSGENAPVYWVPGAYELPVIAQQLAVSGDVDAVICLGCVIRGDTAHFDYVAGECASGLSKIALDNNVPVAFGVLTTDTIEQAIERSGTKAGNKGADAAMSALEMVSLLRNL